MKIKYFVISLLTILPAILCAASKNAFYSDTYYLYEDDAKNGAGVSLGYEREIKPRVAIQVEALGFQPWEDARANVGNKSEFGAALAGRWYGKAGLETWYLGPKFIGIYRRSYVTGFPVMAGRTDHYGMEWFSGADAGYSLKLFSHLKMSLGMAALYRIRSFNGLRQRNEMVYRPNLQIGWTH